MLYVWVVTCIAKKHVAMLIYPVFAPVWVVLLIWPRFRKLPSLLFLLLFFINRSDELRPYGHTSVPKKYSPASCVRLPHLLVSPRSELPMSSVRLLRCWLSRVPEDHFHHYVEIFSQYVTVHHHPNQRPDQHLINALRSLQVLSEANELACRDLERHLVDPSLFYNDSVSRKIDFKEEYQIWKRSHAKNEKYALQLWLV